MLTFVGFNNFGQFSSLEDTGETFTYLKEDSIENEEIIISPSWSYTAFAFGNKLVLKGFLGHPDAILKLSAENNIRALAACDRFCLVLMNNGQLFKLNPNKESKLEKITLETSSISNELPQKRSLSGELKNCPDLQIDHIACGNTIAVAITSTNEVFNVPSLIHKFPNHVHVKQLVCGFEHVLMLSTNGDVYSWGTALRGQLGQDDVEIQREHPIIVEALSGIKVKCIAAGGWHSVALSAFGDIYIWGFNSNGQIGKRIYNGTFKKEPSVFFLPELIDLPSCCEDSSSSNKSADNEDLELSYCTPVEVYAGARHTIVRMDCGTLFVTGWNKYNQLGLNRKIDFIDTFEKMETSANPGNEYKVICAPWSTIFKK